MAALITLNYRLLERFDLLSIGLLQESAPELRVIRRAEVDQSVVHSGQQVIDPHLFPPAVDPELHTGETKTRGVSIQFQGMEGWVWAFTLKVKQPL